MHESIPIVCRRHHTHITLHEALLINVFHMQERPIGQNTAAQYVMRVMAFAFSSKEPQTAQVVPFPGHVVQRSSVSIT